MFYSFADAKRIVQAHAGHGVAEGGRSIIDQVRPYSGVEESDFHELMLALISVHDALGAERIDRELALACWDFSRRMGWIVKTLQANKVVTPQKAETLTTWGNCVESFCIGSLYPWGLGACLMNFIEYVGSDLCEQPVTYRDLLPLFDELLVEANFELEPLLHTAIAAIQKDRPATQP
ncbi:hypothetical protein AB1L30_05635 [Bremerella sp. JC817]|uniref:hypothetical protein n=1 Tax=Bremerella sp. JC817 TaxID=3231756 RepID=UPI0034576413